MLHMMSSLIRTAKLILLIRYGLGFLTGVQSYRFTDKSCRRCGQEDETLQHIVNCREEDYLDTQIVYNLDDEISYETRLTLQLISRRVNDFLEEVK